MCVYKVALKKKKGGGAFQGQQALYNNHSQSHLHCELSMYIVNVIHMKTGFSNLSQVANESFYFVYCSPLHAYTAPLQTDLLCTAHTPMVEQKDSYFLMYHQRKTNSAACIRLFAFRLCSE